MLRGWDPGEVMMQDPSNTEVSGVHLSTDLNPEETIQLVQKVAKEQGFNFTFQEGSNPTFIFKLGDERMQQKGTSTKVQVDKMTNSTIGIVGNARDIEMYNHAIRASDKLDDKLKEVLLNARAELDKIDLQIEDKEDIADNLGKLTAELEKGVPEKGRVQRFLGRIKELAPSVADILSMAASIGELAT